MFRKTGIACFFIFLLLAILSGGCIPADSRVDEEKDPHFERGRNLASSQDFNGAVAEFEKALETNPRSAAAHFELGWLYDTKINDYAAPLYNAGNTDLRPYESRGGKLILWHGLIDESMPTATTIAYYQGVQKQLGDKVTDSFVRLFLLPGAPVSAIPGWLLARRLARQL